MRMMLRASVDADSGNHAMANGTMDQVISDTIARIKPEASYFFVDGGERSALFVFDLKNASDVPGIVEPIMMALNAQVDLIPVLSHADLQKGMKAWMGGGKKSGKKKSGKKS